MKKYKKLSYGFSILVIFLLICLGLSSGFGKEPYDCCEIYADDCQCMNGCEHGCDCTIECETSGLCEGPATDVCCFCYVP